MPDLIARGEDPDRTWRRTLPDHTVTLGRVPDRCDWAAPWDKQISSRHATLNCRDGRLFIRRLPDSRNPIFRAGQDQHFEEFSIAVGECFSIGGTAFTLVATPSAASGDFTPEAELTCTREELREFKYIDSSERLEALAILPEVIRGAPADGDLEERVVTVLLRGIPQARAAAVVELKPGEDGEVVVRTARTRGGSSEEVRPSRRLLVDAIQARRQTVFFRHGGRRESGGGDYTVMEGLDWALCVPLPDDPIPGGALYVTGRRSQEPFLEAALKSDLKFAELVADIFGALRQVRDLQTRQAVLTRFLSRPVLAELALGDVEQVLQPRETEATVLFCDLRGSCLIAEEGQGNLEKLWRRVRDALNIMTSNICDQDGVIGDFQGDAAMGFWGWPMDHPDRVERAARAALGIRRDFLRAAAEPGHPLAGFACGIGVATGPVYAGKLGTYDQFKVGVFGPVVNLASRLESMTKQFQAPILLDETSAQRLAVPRNTFWCRCRRLARVQPHGMTTVLTVSELLPSGVEPGALKEHQRRDCEAALKAFEDGRWQDADGLLHRLPVSDGPAQFLREFMQKHGHTPPAGWAGVIQLDSK